MFNFSHESLKIALYRDHAAGVFFCDSLRRFFRNQGVRNLSGLRSHDLHFAPVVTEFLTAVQARDVSARALTHLRAARPGAHRNRKTIASMPTTKHGIHQL